MQIFLIEDDESIIRVMQLRFQRVGYTVHVARTKLQAIEFLKDSPPISVMLVDGLLAGESTNTCDLITTIRAQYSGLMIAMSSDDDVRKCQLCAGCDIESMNKVEAVRFVLEMSNSPKPFAQIAQV